MKIGKYLSLSYEIETQISGLYEKVATLTPDAPTSRLLINIYHEELQHASVIRMSKSFLKAAPDIFADADFDETELNRGLKECHKLRDRVDESLAFPAALNGLLDLEKSFEKIHTGVSVIVSDVQLKQLFQTLAKGDRNHIKTLEELIANT
jgi:rubrerythrin